LLPRGSTPGIERRDFGHRLERVLREQDCRLNHPATNLPFAGRTRFSVIMRTNGAFGIFYSSSLGDKTDITGREGTETALIFKGKGPSMGADRCIRIPHSTSYPIREVAAALACWLAAGLGMAQTPQPAQVRVRVVKGKNQFQYVPDSRAPADSTRRIILLKG